MGIGRGFAGRVNHSSQAVSACIFKPGQINLTWARAGSVQGGFILVTYESTELIQRHALSATDRPAATFRVRRFSEAALPFVHAPPPLPRPRPCTRSRRGQG